ncbi:MAG: hypothetical protein ACOCV2_07580 [Persicimonas sp.]
MASSEHDHHELTPPDDVEVGKNFYILGAAMTLIGALAFVGGLFGGMELRAWQGYLIGFWFTLSLSLCGPFFVATQYLSSAGWSASIRRVAEALGYFLVPAAILGLIGLLGAEELYHWLDPETRETDYIIKKKLGFLNMTGMTFTTVIAFVGFIATFWWLRRNSVKQDETADASLFERNKIASVAFMVVFVLGFSFLTWYWLMSLSPHWFSTMFQVYTFAALFQGGLALITIMVLYLNDRGHFGDFVGVDQIHTLGKLVFAFTVFYAYISFGQFLLIWYANIPEEAIWFLDRIQQAGGWGWFIAMFSLKFIIPFLVLSPRDNKMNKYNVLRYTCYGLVFALLFEIWWWVSFNEFHGELHIVAPWLELLITVGFVGIFLIAVGRGLSSAHIIPVNDPFLHESLPHHDHGELPDPDVQVEPVPQADDHKTERED